MTVLENLIVAQHNYLMDKSFFSIKGLLNFKSYKNAENEALEKSIKWLNLIGLKDKANTISSNLPYGQQRKLEIARCMCTEPAILCLDEPAAGLNQAESLELNKLLRLIVEQEKVSILLIEHDMSVVMGISNHIIVLDYGKNIANGTPSEIKNDPDVIKAYLGEE